MRAFGLVKFKSSLEPLTLFFSNEGNPREPIHVHVRKDGNRAKFWLNPVCLANNQGYTGKELNKLAQIVEARAGEIERAWHEHFGY